MSNGLLMRPPWKAWAAGVVVGLYLFVGLQFGLALQRYMPAVNGLGVAYVTVTWPFHLKVNPIAAPVATWMFDLDRARKENAKASPETTKPEGR